MEDKVIEYMQLSKQAKEIAEAMDLLKPQVLELVGEEGFEYEGKKIQKVSKMLPKVKEEYSITDIMSECPEGIINKPDMKWLQNNEAGHKFVEFTRSEYLLVK